MTGYFGSLIRQTGVSVASWAPRPATSAFDEQGNGPRTEFEAVIQETVEIAVPPSEAVLDPLLPRPRAEESIASRYEQGETARAESALDSRVDDHSTVTPAQPADAARVYPSIDGETPAFSAIAPPEAPPTIERHETREIRGDSGESPSIRVGNRGSKELPESTFERAQVWHETYRSVRDWVAASPSSEGVPESIERHDSVESPGARRAITSVGTVPPAAAESPSRDQSAVPEIHVSIGTISVVVEEPAAKPPAPQQTGQVRQEPAAPCDWTRLRRLYIR